MIQLRTLCLEPFNLRNGAHLVLARRLNEDEAVYRFISKHFFEWIEPPETDSIYEVSKSYVITSSDEKIGMLGSTSFNKSGIIDLWCVIDKHYRNCGYGEKVLAQMTMFLVENMKNLNDIKLVINKTNRASEKTAIKCGYNLVDKYDDSLVYRYFKK